MTKPGFQTTDNKGFAITFDNGYGVSVQFGPGNYCENRTERAVSPDFLKMMGSIHSKNAEVAVFGPDDKMIKDFFGENHTVEGWQNPQEVLALLNKVANFGSEEK